QSAVTERGVAKAARVVLQRRDTDGGVVVAEGVAGKRVKADGRVVGRDNLQAQGVVAVCGVPKAPVLIGEGEVSSCRVGGVKPRARGGHEDEQRSQKGQAEEDDESAHRAPPFREGRTSSGRVVKLGRPDPGLASSSDSTRAFPPETFTPLAERRL